MLGTQEQRTAGMKKQAQELIEQAYQRGYKAGYSKAENDYHAQTEDDRQSSYELGLNMAWEAAKKIAGDCFSDSKMTKKVFNFHYSYAVFENFSASEAIEKIKEYEKKMEPTVQLGDEVQSDDGVRGVVVGSFRKPDGTEEISVLSTNYKVPQLVPREYYKKTGCYFQEISEVLKKLKERNNG